MSEIARLNRPESWRREFITKHRGRCTYCNRRGSQDMGPDERPWHVDHKQPLARGGVDEEDNLTLACKRCNLAKGVQPYAQFAAFAKAAFWVPDDWRVSEFDLDHLMDVYGKVQNRWTGVGGDSKWRVDDDDRIVVLGPDGPNYPEVVVKLGDDDGSRMETAHPKTSVLDFIVFMYELMPAMAAEIRMLRSEIEEKRGSSGSSGLGAVA
jgi:hypothetical protein